MEEGSSIMLGVQHLFKGYIVCVCVCVCVCKVWNKKDNSENSINMFYYENNLFKNLIFLMKILCQFNFQFYLSFLWYGLFNSISTPYELFKDKIWFICICLSVIITIFSMFHWTLFISHLFAHSYMVPSIPI